MPRTVALATVQPSASPPYPPPIISCTTSGAEGTWWAEIKQEEGKGLRTTKLNKIAKRQRHLPLQVEVGEFLSVSWKRVQRSAIGLCNNKIYCIWYNISDLIKQYVFETIYFYRVSSVSNSAFFVYTSAHRVWYLISYAITSSPWDCPGNPLIGLSSKWIHMSTGSIFALPTWNTSDWHRTHYIYCRKKIIAVEKYITTETKKIN